MNGENDIAGTHLKILILEDSPQDFELIQEQLTEAGYKLDLTHVEDEAGFTSALRENCYNIILSDFRLPGFDAFGALQISNELCPEVPFICISGSIGEETAIELLKQGAVDYVLKDRPERLPFAVKRAIKEQKEKQALSLAEEELKKNETKFRTLTENIPDIIARFDKELRHIYINPAIEKITGISSHAVLGKTNEELGMPEEKNAIWNANIQYVFETAKQLIYEFDFQTPDGNTMYFSSMLVPELSEDGKVKTILSVTRDISKNKLAEIALRKSEERLRDVLFSTADWVWEVDKDGKYTYSSQKGNELFEAPLEEIIGKTPFDFMPKDEAIKIASIFAEIVNNKAPIKDLENWNIGKGGKLICLLTNGLPILDDEGELIGYRGIDKNITDRKLTEQELMNAKEKAEASDKLKTAFINNISHEIRTPLNGILGFGQLIIDSELTADQRVEYFKIVQKSSNRLMNTVSDYMDMARIVSGTMEVHKNEFLLQPLFSEIIENTAPLCAEKKIDFEAVIPKESPDKTIYSDSEIIRKTLNILLDNALKFAKVGSISCGYVLKSDFIEFFVKDSGVGIAPDKLELIFGMFTQEETSNTRGYEGSGLGLTIAQGLVKLLGGTIKVNSEKGKGSVFTFTVPYNKPSLSDNHSFTHTKKLTDTKKHFVLIAEDEELNYLYLEVIMKMIGCNYLHALNGAEAVEICKHNRSISLVLMDIKMPVMNGLEATQLIHEFLPELPIIATTAYAQTGDENRFLAAGCNGYLSKPIKKANLVALLNKFLFNLNLNDETGHL